MSRSFVIDTNVVVAGLINARKDSPVARILDGMLNAQFNFVASEALLAEYRAVLLRPPIRKLHGLSETNVDTLLVDIVLCAIMVNPVTNIALRKAPDPGDQFLWDLLGARADLVLVTGDKLLLQDSAMQPNVIAPQSFITYLDS